MPPRRMHFWDRGLSPYAHLYVRWEAEVDVVRYSVVLLARVDGRWWTAALFDCSHDDRNDRHRYARDGSKGPAEPFHHGTPGEAMRAAIDLIERDFERMIDAWRM